MPSGGSVSTSFVGFGPPHGGIFHPQPALPPSGLVAGLIVGNKAALTAGDVIVLNRLAKLGFRVVLMDDDDASYSGAHLFVGAESCTGASLAAKLSHVVVPVVLFEHAVTDDMDMSTVAGPTGAAEDNIVILDPTSPMAGGMTGTISVMIPATRLDYNNASELAGSALSIYSTEASSTQIVTYGYEAGATMLNSHVAEARRVFCGLGVDASLTNLDLSTGAALIDAAISWAITAPAVAAGNVVVTPDPAVLTLAFFAPDIGVGVVIVPDVAALTLTAFAPTATVSANQSVVPGVASFTLTGFAPQLQATVTPATAALALASFAPVLKLTVTPGPAALTLSSSAPTVTSTNNQVATPGTASLVLSAFAPQLRLTVTPPAASLTLSGLAPTVTATANQTVVPGAAALALASFAPLVTGGAGLTVVPGKASVTLSGFAPTVTMTANQTATPGTASLSLGSFAPTVTAPNNKVVIPATALLTLLGLAPTVTATGQSEPGTVGATAAVRDSVGSAAVLVGSVAVASALASSGAATISGSSVGASAVLRDKVGAT